MKKEFKLSETVQVKEVIVNNIGATEIQRLINIKDVKEFIKIVEDIIKDYASIPEKLERLKKATGKELLEDKNVIRRRVQ